jgi:hypothetical protein
MGFDPVASRQELGKGFWGRERRGGWLGKGLGVYALYCKWFGDGRKKGLAGEGTDYF